MKCMGDPIFILFSSHPKWNQFAPKTSIGYLNPTRSTSSGRRFATAVPPMSPVRALKVLLGPARMVVQLEQGQS